MNCCVSRVGTFISTVVVTTFLESGIDGRPEDVSLTSQGLLVVLFKGIEGVAYAEIRIYQLRSSVPLPGSRNIQNMVTGVRAIDLQDRVKAPLSLAGREVYNITPDSRRVRYSGRERTINNDERMRASHKDDSQICIIL